MGTYSLSHLTDQVLLCKLAAVVARERGDAAEVLAHLAEVDERKLYLPAAYPSMYAYCVHELHMSEDSAFKRIRAARTARQFPSIFGALAEGRLHLSGVVMLTPHLTPENAADLLAAATHKTKAEIEQLLAERFPRPDLPELVQDLSPTLQTHELAPGPVDATVAQLASWSVWSPGPRSKLAPLAPERFALQVTLAQGTHEKIRYAQALAGHEASKGELATLIDRAFDAYIDRLEKRKFAATTRPRHSRRGAAARHVPAAVKRTVWERDKGRCTFVSDTGRRCPARTRLEFDHENPVARGGEATAANLRLRCRAHNQYAAECAFGAGFMSQKREEAQRATAAARTAGPAAHQHAPERVEARVQAAVHGQSREREVIPWLRQLGFRLDEARRAAEACEAIPEASLEQRLRFSLRLLAPRCRVEKGPVMAT